MAEAGRFRDALARRDARLLTGAYILDGIGGWAYFVVLLVVVHDRTGSSLMVALTTLAGWLPRLVIGPYGGLLADRYERTAVMRVSSLIAAAIMGTMTAFVALEGPIPVILVLHALLGISLTAYFPAAAAMRPAVVAEKDLVAINALFGALENAVVVLGPLLGGVLFAVGEPSLAFGVNAVTFVLAFLVISAMKVRSKGDAEAGEEPALKQMTAGVVAIWRLPVARVLTLMMALDSAVYGASTVIYATLGEQLGVGSDGLTTLIAAFAVGGVAITVLVNRLAASSQLAPVMLGGMALMTIPFVAVAWTGELWVGLVLQAMAGAGMVVVDVLALTALQRDVPGEVLGRVMGAVDVLVLAGILLSSLAMVPLMEIGGLKLALGSLGGVVLLGTALGLRPLLRADRDNAQRVAELRPRVALLEALDLFNGASRPVLESLAASIEVVVAEEGTTLMRQGDRADALWVVESGSVQVSTRDPFGLEQVRSALGPHSYVGEIGLLHGVVRTATVRTLSKSVLWRIADDDFRNALTVSGTSQSLRNISGSRLRQLQVPPPRPAVDEDAYNTL